MDENCDICVLEAFCERVAAYKAYNGTPMNKVIDKTAVTMVDTLQKQSCECGVAPLWKGLILSMKLSSSSGSSLPTESHRSGSNHPVSFDGFQSSSPSLPVVIPTTPCCLFSFSLPLIHRCHAVVGAGDGGVSAVDDGEDNPNVSGDAIVVVAAIAGVDC